MEFNWNGFDSCQVGFNPKSIYEAEEFLSKCYMRHVKMPKGCTYNTFRFMWFKYTDDTVYYLNSNTKYLSFSSSDNLPDYITEIASN